MVYVRKEKYYLHMIKFLKIKKNILALTLAAITMIYPAISFADDINDVSGVPSDDSNTDTTTVRKDATSSDAIGNMLLQSVSLMGIAYKWGGNTPDTGMDCSGFVRYVFKKSLGINLPRTAAEMAKVGKKVDPNDLEPGDLMFFNTRRGSNTHIGIYLGNNKFIQSPRTGENIKITEFDGWWRQHFNGAKRVVQENVDDNGDTSVESYQDIRDEALPGGYRGKSSRHASRSRHGSKKHATTTNQKSSSKKSSSKKKRKKH